MDEASSPDYEFEGYHLDTAMQVLVSPGGETLPLPSRAFSALRYLVERAGEVVDKSSLMSAVWPKSIVTENNLNQCILALRKALGESASDRRFILTVPGRGFKFVAPVRVVPRGHAAAPAIVPTPAAPAKPGSGKRWALLVGVVGVVLLGALAASRWLPRAGPVTNPSEFVQLTDVADGAVSPVLSPDGHLLAFIRGGAPFLGTGQIWLKVLPSGQPVKLTDAKGPVWSPAFTPDSANVVYTAIDQEHSTWDTWSVPVTGGAAPALLLANAQGLSYIGPHEVLYSEFQSGIHLGIVTSRDDRSHHRQVYLPSHDRGMAHFSALSPDRSAVLIVEMGPSGSFGRCRLAPFDAKSPSYEVGPETGSCQWTAWSPDGRWMYFAAVTAGGSHLWRQRFPHGQPEQITFGPGEEETVFAAADGHSLLTSIGLTETTLWLHQGTTKRALNTEGRIGYPRLSGDGRRVYFLVTRGNDIQPSLARMDITTGQQQTLLQGFDILSFDISADETQVVFATGSKGEHQVWIASLDRQVAPRLLARRADQPLFGGNYVFFRRIDDHVNWLYRIHPDGSAAGKVLRHEILDLFGAAPDGKAVIAAEPGTPHGPAQPGVPLGDAWIAPVDAPGVPHILHAGDSFGMWSRDGRHLYLDVDDREDVRHTGWTTVLDTGPDDMPLGPPSPDGRWIPHPLPDLAIGNDPSTYVFVEAEQRRNIYRVPLH
ncbi:MAG TPA: winged helix-turn-helix domain-containing protein [Steroidobacteraceae bacterium]|nr:winged helix-turn-helix domain-containing protein [Steroidobacteraceae bacterium]